MSKINKILEIIKFVEKYKIKNYNINDDLTVDAEAVVIHDDNLREIPIQFKTVFYFDCSSCRNLISLKGSPERVNRCLFCTNCSSLTSLEGAPEFITGGLYCNNCTSLTSLYGCPKQLMSLECKNCPNLKTLKGVGNVKGTIESDFFIGYLKDYKGEL